MGSIYLAILLVLGSTVCAESSVFGSTRLSKMPSYTGKKLPVLLSENEQQKILFPAPPVAKPPMATTDEDLDADLAIKKSQRKEREGEVKDEHAPTPLKQKLIVEAQKERSYRFYLELSLVAPRMRATGLRESYKADYLASHVSWIWYGHGDPYEAHLLYGVRIGSFSGYGVYDHSPGRFGFLYVGPAIGLGQIQREFPGKDSNAKTAAEKAKSSVVLVQTGWTLLGGLSAQSRTGITDRTTPEVDRDLNTRAIAVDSVGGWVEASWFYLLYGALGLHFNVGLQQGEAKLFYWVGLGTSGWY